MLEIRAPNEVVTMMDREAMESIGATENTKAVIASQNVPSYRNYLLERYSQST